MGNHNSTFRNGAKVPSRKLVNKMAEGIIIFFLALGLLNRKLQLALNFPHEEVVDDNVVGRSVHLITDLDDFELLLHGLFGVQQVHCF